MTHLDGGELDNQWIFADPATSEERFREVLPRMEGAAADELRTQIARAIGLQGLFADALTLLNGITSDDLFVQQRVALERGRVYNSAGDVNDAIPYFRRAFEIGADPYLTVDAIHMLATTDIVHADAWYERGLALAEASSDPRVRRWVGSLRNNHAWNLTDEGALDAALLAFQEAEEWFRVHGTTGQLHIARWSVAHVLRRLGRRDEAREILLYLQVNNEPDSYVDDELALLDRES